MNKINVSRTLSNTNIEGPGKRFAIWVQGCIINCYGCCNQEMIPLIGKSIIDVTKLFSFILDAKKKFNIEGISVFGGEPFIQPKALEELFLLCQQNNLTVLVFSGFLYENLKAKYPDVLKNVDILVDGPFDIRKLDKKRRLIGSTNQRIFYLSDVYKNTTYFNDSTINIELEYKDGSIITNGDGVGYLENDPNDAKKNLVD